MRRIINKDKNAFSEELKMKNIIKFKTNIKSIEKRDGVKQNITKF